MTGLSCCSFTFPTALMSSCERGSTSEGQPPLPNVDTMKSERFLLAANSLDGLLVNTDDEEVDEAKEESDAAGHWRSASVTSLMLAMITWKRVSSKDCSSRANLREVPVSVA